jgi:HEAT repeat protein
MGIFDFLRSEGSGPSERQIRKTVAALTETHGDPYRRRSAASQLLEWGTPKALRALLQRFTIKASSETVDTDEKNDLHDTLVRLGQKAVPPILSYLHDEREIAYPLSALSRILKRERFLEEVMNLLSELDLRDPREAPKKVELLRQLKARSVPTIFERVRVFLDDVDDDVRVMATDILAENDTDETRKQLLQALLDGEGRPRVRMKIAEIFSEKGWPVRGFRKLVEDCLPDGYVMTKKGIIVSRLKTTDDLP